MCFGPKIYGVACCSQLTSSEGCGSAQNLGFSDKAKKYQHTQKADRPRI